MSYWPLTNAYYPPLQCVAKTCSRLLWKQGRTLPQTIFLPPNTDYNHILEIGAPDEGFSRLHVMSIWIMDPHWRPSSHLVLPQIRDLSFRGMRKGILKGCDDVHVQMRSAFAFIYTAGLSNCCWQRTRNFLPGRILRMKLMNLYSTDSAVNANTIATERLFYNKYLNQWGGGRSKYFRFKKQGSWPWRQNRVYSEDELPCKVAHREVLEPKPRSN